MKPIKKVWKVILDAVMLLLLALMYRKSVISMSFHEIGGLALVAFFVLHHLFNGKWITGVTKRIWKGELPAKTKIEYVVDAFLLVTFVLILVSGIFISKVVFSTGTHDGAWKILHYFCAALAVVLCGVHIGLHLNYLFSSCLKTKVKKGVSIAVATIILAFGVYSLTNTSFLKWLSLPFSGADMERTGDGPAFQGEFAPGQVPPDPSASVEIDANVQGDASAELPPEIGSPENTTSTEDKAQDGRGNKQGPGKGAGTGSNYGGQGNGTGVPSGNGKGPGNGGQNGFGHQGEGGGNQGVLPALLLIVNYGSIAALFAALTGLVEWLLRRRKNSKPLKEAV